MKRLDLNTKKQIFGDFRISHFKGEKGAKSLKFRKIQIFDDNSAPNYCSARKCHTRRLDLKIKKTFFGDLGI